MFDVLIEIANEINKFKAKSNELKNQIDNMSNTQGSVNLRYINRRNRVLPSELSTNVWIRKTYIIPSVVNELFTYINSIEAIEESLYTDRALFETNIGVNKRADELIVDVFRAYVKVNTPTEIKLNSDGTRYMVFVNDKLVCSGESGDNTITLPAESTLSTITVFVTHDSAVSNLRTVDGTFSSKVEFYFPSQYFGNTNGTNGSNGSNNGGNTSNGGSTTNPGSGSNASGGGNTSSGGSGGSSSGSGDSTGTGSNIGGSTSGGTNSGGSGSTGGSNSSGGGTTDSTGGSNGFGSASNGSGTTGGNNTLPNGYYVFKSNDTKVYFFDSFTGLYSSISNNLGIPVEVDFIMKPTSDTTFILTKYLPTKEDITRLSGITTPSMSGVSISDLYFDFTSSGDQERVVSLKRHVNTNTDPSMCVAPEYCTPSRELYTGVFGSHGNMYSLTKDNSTYTYSDTDNVLWFETKQDVIDAIYTVHGERAKSYLSPEDGGTNSTAYVGYRTFTCEDKDLFNTDRPDGLFEYTLDAFNGATEFPITFSEVSNGQCSVCASFVREEINVNGVRIGLYSKHQYACVVGIDWKGSPNSYPNTSGTGNTSTPPVTPGGGVSVGTPPTNNGGSDSGNTSGTGGTNTGGNTSGSDTSGNSGNTNTGSGNTSGSDTNSGGSTSNTGGTGSSTQPGTGDGGNTFTPAESGVMASLNWRYTYPSSTQINTSKPTYEIEIIPYDPIVVAGVTIEKIIIEGVAQDYKASTGYATNISLVTHIGTQVHTLTNDLTIRFSDLGTVSVDRYSQTPSASLQSLITLHSTGLTLKAGTKTTNYVENGMQYQRLHVSLDNTINAPAYIIAPRETSSTAKFYNGTADNITINFKVS